MPPTPTSQQIYQRNENIQYLEKKRALKSVDRGGLALGTAYGPFSHCNSTLVPIIWVLSFCLDLHNSRFVKTQHILGSIEMTF